MDQKEYQKEYQKNWKIKNRDKIALYRIKWSRKNRKDKSRIYDLKYTKTTRKNTRKTRRQIDIKYRLDSNMGSAISSCLKRKKLGISWTNLVDYKMEDLVRHFELKFDRNMNWDNYGSYWCIDHIKPKSLFKYESADQKEFKDCWSLDNLQPLEKKENIVKSNHFLTL